MSPIVSESVSPKKPRYLTNIVAIWYCTVIGL